jgi:hypothetical protein
MPIKYEEPSSRPSSIIEMLKSVEPPSKKSSYLPSPLSNENLPKKITNEYFEIEIPLIAQENSKQDKLVEFIQSLDKKIREDAKRTRKAGSIFSQSFFQEKVKCKCKCKCKCK